MLLSFKWRKKGSGRISLVPTVAALFCFVPAGGVGLLETGCESAVGPVVQMGHWSSEGLSILS